MTKTAENRHTLWGRTYLYSPYKGACQSAPLEYNDTIMCSAAYCVPMLYIRAAVYSFVSPKLLFQVWSTSNFTLRYQRIIQRTLMRKQPSAAEYCLVLLSNIQTCVTIHNANHHRQIQSSPLAFSARANLEPTASRDVTEDFARMMGQERQEYFTAGF